MNERIREIAHEAGLPTYNPEGIPTKLEKFALLIVRECVMMADMYADEHLTTKPSEQIKQHFGVES